MAVQEILEGFKAADATVGVTGAVRIAKTGTPYVQGVGKYDPEVQINLGYIGEDGIEESRDEDKAEWTPWQEHSPIREDITASKVSFQFVLWQVNGVTVAYYYGLDGSKITTNEDGSWQFDEGGKPKLETGQMYIDVVDNGRIQRMILAAAQVSERGSIVYKSDEIIGFEITVTATPGPEGWSVRRIFMGYDLAGVETGGETVVPTVSTVSLGDVDGGTFTLGYGGDDTDPLAWNATATEVEAALEALAEIGSGKVSVSGNAGGPWQIVLDGSLSGELTIDGANLTGDAPAPAVSSGN